ncbi:MAG: TerC family protein [Thermomicrobiales bacterium]|nr:TerC family protein [Thermomicrobiales bacterium]
MEILSNPDVWVALLTLTALEIVLGIDNIIFISILSGRLPESQRKRARTVGLGAAMVMRILLLLSINWVIGLTDPIFSIADKDFSGRDLILLLGGAFLLYKATSEIHARLEGEEHHSSGGKVLSFWGVIAQIMLLDIVFSLDSVITAVGMADDVEVMIAAVVISVGVMLFSAGPISEFVQAHPTVKMLALSFLLMIGFSLIAEGWGLHIPKGYIYAAMGFSVLVEMLNLRVAKNKPHTPEPVQLREGVGVPKDALGD